MRFTNVTYKEQRLLDLSTVKNIISMLETRMTEAAVSTWIEIPYILESGSFMIRSPSTGDDQGKDDHTKEYDYFDTREPKLEFSEEANSEVIYSDDCHQDDCNIQCRARPWPIILDIVEPILNHES